MKFNFPVIFDQEPTPELLAQYGCKGGKYLQIGMKIAKKSYMRVVLAEQQNWKCCWCGCDTVAETHNSNSATIEHVQPLSKGGANEWENFASACSSCNNNRGTSSVEDFLERKDLHGEAGKSLLKQEAQDNRFLRKAKKLADNDWKRFQQETETWHNIPFVDWIESIGARKQIKEQLIKLYGEI